MHPCIAFTAYFYVILQQCYRQYLRQGLCGNIWITTAIQAFQRVAQLERCVLKDLATLKQNITAHLETAEALDTAQAKRAAEASILGDANDHDVPKPSLVPDYPSEPKPTPVISQYSNGYDTANSAAADVLDSLIPDPTLACDMGDFCQPNTAWKQEVWRNTFDSDYDSLSLGDTSGLMKANFNQIYESEAFGQASHAEKQAATAASGDTNGPVEVELDKVDTPKEPAKVQCWS